VNQSSDVGAHPGAPSTVRGRPWRGGTAAVDQRHQAAAAPQTRQLEASEPGGFLLRVIVREPEACSGRWWMTSVGWLAATHTADRVEQGRGLPCSTPDRGIHEAYGKKDASMIKLATAGLMVLLGSPALAQSTPPRAPATEKPIDNGPTSPQANGAYQGGGVVLQGAPGASAPAPQATSPGQAPAGSVEALPPVAPNAAPSKAADD
jgi:hypothetical protein